MYIRWDPSFETGHPLIDTEHRLLVMLFRKLDIAIKTRETDPVIVRIVTEVQRFVEFHFVSEENLMQETGYPEQEAHRQRHVELLLTLSAKLAQLHAHREFPEDVLDFLNDWLIGHIARADQEVARHACHSERRPVGELVYLEYLGARAPGPTAR